MYKALADKSKRLGLPAEDFADPERRLFPVMDAEDLGAFAALQNVLPPAERARYAERVRTIASRKGLALPQAMLSADPVVVAFGSGTLSPNWQPADVIETVCVFGDEPGQESGGLVFRKGKIFEAADYADKQFAMSPEEMMAAVANFRPVDLDLEHMPTVLDGKLGRLVEVEIGPDGWNLYGTAGFSKWFDEQLQAGERKVSCTWHRKNKNLLKLAVVKTPRVADAAMFGEQMAVAFGNAGSPAVADTIFVSPVFPDSIVLSGATTAALAPAQTAPPAAAAAAAPAATEPATPAAPASPASVAAPAASGAPGAPGLPAGVGALLSGVGFSTRATEMPALLGELALFAKHNTTAGQIIMQRLHDDTARAGAVCQKPKGGEGGQGKAKLSAAAPVTFHSAHELTGIQDVHDITIAHGAKCDSISELPPCGYPPFYFAGEQPATDQPGTTGEGSTMTPEEKAQQERSLFASALTGLLGVLALFTGQQTPANVAALSAQQPQPGQPQTGTTPAAPATQPAPAAPATAPAAPAAPVTQPAAPAAPAAPATPDAATASATQAAAAAAAPAAMAATAAAAPAPAAPAATATQPAAGESAELAAARQREYAEFGRRVASEATSFADRIILVEQRALPKDRDQIIADVTAAMMDDRRDEDTYGAGQYQAVVGFTGEGAERKAVMGARLDMVKARWQSRAKHGLTVEMAASVGAATQPANPASETAEMTQEQVQAQMRRQAAQFIAERTGQVPAHLQPYINANGSPAS